MALAADRPQPIRIDAATANDNTKPAGRLDGTTLSVSLELRDAAWQPGGPGTRSIRVFAFADRGRAPSVPGEADLHQSSCRATILRCHDRSRDARRSQPPPPLAYPSR